MNCHGDLWKLENLPSLPDSMAGAHLKVGGRVAKGRKEIQVVQHQLTKFDGLEGKRILLTGLVFSWKEKLWLEAGELNLELDFPRSEFKSINEYDEITVSGQLVSVIQPDIRLQYTAESPKLVKGFLLTNLALMKRVVRKSRFVSSGVYDDPNSFSDGVLNLVNRSERFHNLWPGYTSLYLRYRRNLDLIYEIAKRDSPETRRVLRKRLLDQKIDRRLRLLYGGILLSLNDSFAQQWLLEKLKSRKTLDLDTIMACWALSEVSKT